MELLIKGNFRKNGLPRGVVLTLVMGLLPWNYLLKEKIQKSCLTRDVVLTLVTGLLPWKCCVDGLRKTAIREGWPLGQVDFEQVVVCVCWCGRTLVLVCA